MNSPFRRGIVVEPFGISLGFSSQPHLAVQIAPRFLFQAVQGQPTDLILNGCIESLGLVCVLKGPEPPPASGRKDRDAWTMPTTIDDPTILLEIAAALQRRLSRAESIPQELRNEVRNLTFAMWVERVQGGGSYFRDASSDWFTARNQLGIPSDLLL
jgi:hypothetical protein